MLCNLFLSFIKGGHLNPVIKIAFSMIKYYYRLIHSLIFLTCLFMSVSLCALYVSNNFVTTTEGII